MKTYSRKRMSLNYCPGSSKGAARKLKTYPKRSLTMLPLRPDGSKRNPRRKKSPPRKALLPIRHLRTKIVATSPEPRGPVRLKPMDFLALSACLFPQTARTIRRNQLLRSMVRPNVLRKLDRTLNQQASLIVRKPTLLLQSLQVSSAVCLLPQSDQEHRTRKEPQPQPPKQGKPINSPKGFEGQI